MIIGRNRRLTGANSGTGMGSVVGRSLLKVDFLLTFGLGHGDLTNPEWK